VKQNSGGEADPIKGRQQGRPEALGAAPPYAREAIRKGAPRFGFKPDRRVVSMK
jgi:hypothetical protein